jgi:hypothetical protein
MTGKPHLTRRWPFGRVTEGLPTNWNLSPFGQRDRAYFKSESCVKHASPISQFREILHKFLPRALIG